MIEVVRFSREHVAAQAANKIAQTITELLKTGPTLCLLSGGSVGNEVVPELFKLLHDTDQLGNLHIGLIDERFGKVGHEQSNAVLLEKVGLTHLTHHGAHFYPVLHSRYTNETETATAYALQLQNLITGCSNRTIGVFGIGSDGHTAGIKPMAKEKFTALYVPNSLVVGYKAEDFTRITITPECIRKITHCYVYVADVSKNGVVQTLLQPKTLSLYEFPAGIFQTFSSEMFITDEINV